MFYVYIHYKADTKEPFYVGKGTKNRATITHNRSSFWNNIYKKHGFYHEIIQTFPTEEEAFQLEKELIASLSKTHKLANLTLGGEGTSGFSPTQETREKKRILQTGRKHSDDTKDKIAHAVTGITRSEETKQKIAQARKGTKHSQETRQKIGKALAVSRPHLTGPSATNFKGYIYGLSETNLVVFQGPNDINSRTVINFNAAHIYQQLRGNLNHHKGFKFYRTQDLTTVPRNLPPLDKETEAFLQGETQ